MKGVHVNAVSLFSLHVVGLFIVKLLKQCYLNYNISPRNSKRLCKEVSKS